MTPDTPNPASAAARTGSGNDLKRLAFEVPGSITTATHTQAQISRNPRAVREAKRQLNLEFLHECAGGIALHCNLIQTFAEIGDPAGACYALKRLFAHVNAAHPVYDELCDETREATP